MAKGRPNDAPPTHEKQPMFEVPSEPVPEPAKPPDVKPPDVKPPDVPKPKPKGSPDSEFALMARITRQLNERSPKSRRRIIAYLISRHTDDEEEGKPANE